MITFREAIAVHRPPYDFLATGAYATDEGTLTECLVVNGTARWADTARLAREADRAVTAGLIAAATSCDTGTAEGALLELHLHVEAYLRGDHTQQSRAQCSEETPEEPVRRSWPILNPVALSGLAGDIVRAVDPETEADPAATLINTLVFFGNAAGRAPHALVSRTRHGVQENGVAVGDTAKGRKGTGLGPIRDLFDRVDPGWTKERIVGGLSSGEGLIAAVRREDDQAGGDTVTDGRLLVIEEEYARPLKMLEREGNILSTILRQAWDGTRLSTLTKNNPLRVDGAHISLLGHITRNELLRYLTETEAANGNANRILWFCVRRSKELPDGGLEPAYGDIVPRLKGALDFARALTAPMQRDDQARLMWHTVYHDLSAGKPGLLGAVVSRSEAHVLRLSMLYALLDRSPRIRTEHLQAALALWDYCEDSARYIFGDKLGDPVADAILAALREKGGAGMDRTDIYHLFGKNMRAGTYQAALDQLLEAELITMTREKTDGAPRVVYHAR